MTQRKSDEQNVHNGSFTYVAERKVLALAASLGVHPGLLVGQLQRRLRRYDLLRKHQVKVRELVVRSARTDGWGV